MTGLLLGAILAVLTVVAVEAYVLLGRAQLLLTYGEQLLGAGARLLTAVPGLSAERTTATADDGPRPWFPRLRLLAELRERLTAARADHQADEAVDAPADQQQPTDLELDRWADDGGRDQPDDDPPPAAPGPATQPTPRIHIAGGLRLPDFTDTAPVLDDVDRQLARFTYAEGHQR